MLLLFWRYQVSRNYVEEMIEFWSSLPHLTRLSEAGIYGKALKIIRVNPVRKFGKGFEPLPQTTNFFIPAFTPLETKSLTGRADGTFFLTG